jgi:hypothetical protein
MFCAFPGSNYSEMLTRLQQINSVEDLRDYVSRTICNQYQLQTGAFPMTERILRRRDKPCGIHFFLHGPRATQFSAIWETDRNKILFYGSGGERFQTTQLIDSPQIQPYASN